MKLRRSKRPESSKSLKVVDEGRSTPPDLSPKSKQRLSLLHCKDCGQSHEGLKPHLYDYDQTVDQELTCRICHQPLVDPIDTKCGHTFCQKCMHNWLKEHLSCPLDRRPLTKDDVKPASHILRKLLDKLLVVCPNVDYCEEVLPRCELQAHLQYRCKGAVIKCLRADQGCTFQGPRSALQSHLWDCPYRDFSKDPDSIGWVPVSDGGVTTLDIQRGCYELGISIVGGIDTPLMCIVIQEVHSEGIVGKDGRLQSGDQLLEVNGIDLTNATHAEARDALRQPYPVYRLTVYREKSETAANLQKQEILDILLPKLPGQHLGIKLVNKRNGPGLYIQELIPGSLAFLDNKLKKDDRILSIGDNDLTYGSQEQASKFIQDARGQVHFRVSRQVTVSPTPDITHDSPSKESLLNFSVYSKESLFSYYPFKQCQERTVTIHKASEESLGISVAGGLRNQKGDSPIYITNILNTGCIGRSQQVTKGDILLSINGHSLLDLTHTEAVRLLKTWASDTTISLRLLEGAESCTGLDNFAPTWKYWLCLPEFCHIVKTVQLERSVTGSLGFSIVGGCDSGQGLVPIYVKAVVPGTPASDDGRLRSGDMLLGVNGQSLESVTHTQAVSLLKGAKGNKVMLRVVSWPGTYV